MSRLSATRAVAHWAWRMFRRDWRGQSLVLLLLTVAVAVSSYGAALGHALAPSDRASFGSATARIRFTTNNPALAASTVSAANRSFGTVEQISDALRPGPGQRPGPGPAQPRPAWCIRRIHPGTARRTLPG